MRSNRSATVHSEQFHDDIKPFVKFLALSAAQKSVVNRWLFRTIAINLIDSSPHPRYGQKVAEKQSFSRKEMIEQLEAKYATYLYSKPDGDTLERFYACPLDEMSMETLIAGDNRQDAVSQFEKFLADNVDFSILRETEKSWYWQSKTYPQLVLLKEWFT